MWRIGLLSLVFVFVPSFDAAAKWSPLARPADREPAARITACGEQREPSSFDQKEEALAAQRESQEGQLLPFQDKPSLDKFLANPTEGYEACRGLPGNATQPVITHDTPSPSLQQRFIKAVGMGDLGQVSSLVRQVPGLLIDSTAHPRRFAAERLNALHIAARFGAYQVGEFILAMVASGAIAKVYAGRRSTIPDAAVLTVQLLDDYLNGVEMDAAETPLHLAAKYGWKAMVRILVAYPQCEMKRNSSGQFPQDLVCESATPERNTHECRRAIDKLLRDSYFVPLIRTESNVELPYIGEPFARRHLPDLGNTGTIRKLRFLRIITAFAGPMTLSEAQAFRREWKTPPRVVVHADAGPGAPTSSYQYRCDLTGRLYDRAHRHQAAGIGERAFRRAHVDCALERIGRSLARTKGVEWKEYWAFLGAYQNLSDTQALAIFERYLERQVAVARARPDHDPVAIGGKQTHPQNLWALCALRNVSYDEGTYPLVSRWQRKMHTLYAALLDKDGADAKTPNPIANVGRISS
uniref:ANKLE2 third alpha/beta domain-containing protein n=1 Tax=Anopheles melas TaxID=34690 RepID=A0A182TJG1_9DIPT